MHLRRSVATAGVLAFAACAGQTTSFKSLYITGSEVREKGVETAYDVIANHRELIVIGDEIAFRGGMNLDGDNNRVYTRPLLIVDGNRDVGDVTTVLRRIEANDIALIRLLYASEVPPEDRRPEAIGGVIEITTLGRATSRR